MSTATAHSKPRIELYDNIKGVLIVLVVIGHFMHPVHNDNPAISAGFDIIYLFHMPLFVFMSGLFAKGAYRDGKLAVNRIISYLVLGFAYQAALVLINGSALFPKLFLFSSAPWYLIAMAWWYVMTPLLARVRPAVGIAASSAIALAWGAVDLSSGLLASSRTLTFLPWFACGYYLDPERVARIRTSRWLWAAVPVAAAVAIARLANPTIYDWFFQRVYGDTPYLAGTALGMVEKVVATGISVVFSLAVIKLTPAGGHPHLLALGQRTLQVYVLHRLLRAALTFRTPFYDLPILLDPVWGTLIILAISALACAACAALPLQNAFNRLMRHAWLRSVR